MQVDPEPQQPSIQTTELTYCYYSNFQLFEESQRDELILSQRFIYKLRLTLGEEWRAHASNSVFVQSESALAPLRSEVVFDTLLVVWLQFLKASDEPDEDEGLKQFEMGARAQFQQFVVDEVFLKPVMDGFFFSAVTTWQKLKLASEEPSATRTSTPPDTQSIKPLAMVTKRIMNYLRPGHRSTLSNRLEQLSLDDNEEEGKDQLVRPLNKLKKVTKLYEKLMQQQLVQTTYHYLGSLLNKTQNTYQVAQSFVMNIIEVNQSHLSHISTSTKDLVKVRLLQPAQGFYNDLMEAWILMRQQNTSSLVHTHIQLLKHFKSYLTTVKTLQGSHWNDRFIGPTQFFFNTLAGEWKQINKKPSLCFQEEEQKFKQLFVNVKEQMRVYWDKEIIEKAMTVSQTLQR